MSETEFGIEREIHTSGLDEKPSLPDSLREWLVYPDEWVMERDAIQMQNELLQTERDELLQYVRNLKKLAVYLSGKTSIGENYLSTINFEKAEENLLDSLRKQIKVALYA